MFCSPALPAAVPPANVEAPDEYEDHRDRSQAQADVEIYITTSAAVPPANVEAPNEYEDHRDRSEAQADVEMRVYDDCYVMIDFIFMAPPCL